jgi:dienelactone hydrolase
VRTEEIEYEADGRTMIGHLVVGGDDDGARPGILVAHEGPGLDTHARDVADRLAELGYAVFALDYVGGGQPLPGEQLMEVLGPLMGEPMRIRQLAQAGLDVLLAQPEVDASRIVTMGFCFGGTLVLELARGGADVLATIGFHSGLGTAHPEDATNIRGQVLVLIGADDPIIPPEQRSEFETEMRAGGVDWRMELYGGVGHSFTNPAASELGMPGIEYHEPSDRRSWASMLELLGETIPLS